MAAKLITLPLRVWIGSARLLARAAGGVAGRALSLAGQNIGVSSSDRSDHRIAHDEQPREPRPAAGPSPTSRSTAAAPARPEPRPEPVRPVQPAPAEESVDVSEEPVDVSEEPAHVSREPELVREEAEPGAEDGAGAAVNVLEPWNGYARMNAREIIERAKEATAAELAAVRLYESRHRSRQTVLAAVDRQLKTGNGSAPA